MFKKKVALLIICLLLFPIFFIGENVQAESKPNLSFDEEITATFVIGQDTYTVNGQEYRMDAAPFIKDGRTLLPVRYLGYALGAEASWDSNTKTAVLTRDQVMQQFVVGNCEKRLVGSLKRSPGTRWKILSYEWGSLYETQFGDVVKLYKTMDVAPLIKDNRAYLPVREVCEGFMADVSWDGQTKTVTINRKVRKPYAPKPTAEMISYNPGSTQVLLDQNETYQLSAAPQDGKLPFFDFLKLNGIAEESWEYKYDENEGTYVFKLYLNNNWWVGFKANGKQMYYNGYIWRIDTSEGEVESVFAPEFANGVLMLRNYDITTLILSVLEHSSGRGVYNAGAASQPWFHGIEMTPGYEYAMMTPKYFIEKRKRSAAAYTAGWSEEDREKYYRYTFGDNKELWPN